MIRIAPASTRRKRPPGLIRRSSNATSPNASANLYSLVETCKANGIDPYRYLTWLFQRLPLATTVDDYDALLPWKMPADLR